MAVDCSRAAIGRPRADEGLRGQRGQVERHAELAAEAEREAEVLAGEIHGEIDVVTAVEDELRLGLVHERVAGRGADDLESRGEIDAAALGQHQRLARGDEVDEGEHVGDDLDHRGRADRADVEDAPPHRRQRGPVALEQLRLAADDDGDLAGLGQMHAAGDGTLQGGDAFLRRLRGHAR